MKVSKNRITKSVALAIAFAIISSIGLFSIWGASKIQVAIDSIQVESLNS